MNVKVSCFSTVLILVLVILAGDPLFSQAQSSAQRSEQKSIPQKLARLQGTIGLEVHEPTKFAPLRHRYFLKQWDGSDFRHIYLEGEHDFAELLHREVVLEGFVSDPVTINGDREAEPTSFYQKMTVSKIVKAMEVDTLVDIFQAGPLTLPPPTKGVHKMLVMPVTFASEPTTQFTPEQAKGWVFTDQRSMRNWTQEASFGAYDLQGNNDPSGDVAPWLALTASPENCMTNMGNAWRVEADNMAEAQGSLKRHT